MNFADQIAVALSMGRELAEARMRGSCVIERRTGETVDDYGVVVPSWEAVYSGKSYVRYPGIAFEASREVAGATVTEARVVVRIPFGTQHRPGDRVTVTADPDNPHLVGDVYVVESVDSQSQATAQRLLCSDSQSGDLGGVTSE